MSVELKVDWCSYKAAKYAVESWHYSGTMPAGKLVKIGAWEDGNFLGAVIFGRGANPNLLQQFGLSTVEGCELVRVALKSHRSYVSEILSKSIKMLRGLSSGLRLIVSYADTDEGHQGGIYQATNWVYSGIVELNSHNAYYVNGKKVHRRSVQSLIQKQGYGRASSEEDWVRLNLDQNATKHIGGGKHRYLYPLDRAMRRQIAPLAQPYPKKEHAGEVSKVTC